MDDVSDEFIYSTLVAAATAHRSGYIHTAHSMVLLAIDAYIVSRGEENVPSHVFQLRNDIENGFILDLWK